MYTRDTGIDVRTLHISTPHLPLPVLDECSADIFFELNACEKPVRLLFAKSLLLNCLLLYRREFVLSLTATMSCINLPWLLTC